MSSDLLLVYILLWDYALDTNIQLQKFHSGTVLRLDQSLQDQIPVFTSLANDHCDRHCDCQTHILKCIRFSNGTLRPIVDLFLLWSLINRSVAVTHGEQEMSCDMLYWLYFNDCLWMCKYRSFFQICSLSGFHTLTPVLNGNHYHCDFSTLQNNRFYITYP